jgi:hypothetical protein
MGMTHLNLSFVALHVSDEWRFSRMDEPVQNVFSPMTNGFLHHPNATNI